MCHKDVVWVLVFCLSLAGTGGRRVCAESRGVDTADSLVDKCQSLLAPRGKAYRKVVKYSHYYDQLVHTEDRLSGNSRVWGDAPAGVQVRVVSRIIQRLRDEGFGETDIAFALALIRAESGFNPDAAAGTSSAAGLLQLINTTRKTLCKRAGVSADDPFSVEAHLACLPQTLKEMFRFAARKVGSAGVGTSEFYAYAYAYHHDGPTLSSGGLQIAQKKVLPWWDTAKQCLRG